MPYDIPTLSLRNTYVYPSYILRNTYGIYRACIVGNRAHIYLREIGRYTHVTTAAYTLAI